MNLHGCYCHRVWRVPRANPAINYDYTKTKSITILLESIPPTAGFCHHLGNTWVMDPLCLIFQTFSILPYSFLVYSYTSFTLCKILEQLTCCTMYKTRIYLTYLTLELLWRVPPQFLTSCSCFNLANPLFWVVSCPGPYARARAPACGWGLVWLETTFLVHCATIPLFRDSVLNSLLVSSSIVPLNSTPIGICNCIRPFYPGQLQLSLSGGKKQRRTEEGCGNR